MIEFVSSKPTPDGKRVFTQMRRDVEWLLIQGWQLARRPDGVHLSLGAQKQIVRGGVLING